MKTKVIYIFVCMLLISITLPILEVNNIDKAQCIKENIFENNNSRSFYRLLSQPWLVIPTFLLLRLMYERNQKEIETESK